MRRPVTAAASAASSGRRSRGVRMSRLATVRPTTTGSSDTRIVSTSGSSGTLASLGRASRFPGGFVVRAIALVGWTRRHLRRQRRHRACQRRELLEPELFRPHFPGNPRCAEYALERSLTESAFHPAPEIVAKHLASLPERRVHDRRELFLVAELESRRGKRPDAHHLRLDLRPRPERARRHDE